VGTTPVLFWRVQNKCPVIIDIYTNLPGKREIISLRKHAGCKFSNSCVNIARRVIYNTN
jgi:hypothetical protein